MPYLLNQWRLESKGCASKFIQRKSNGAPPTGQHLTLLFLWFRCRVVFLFFFLLFVCLLLILHLVLVRRLFLLLPPVLLRLNLLLIDLIFLIHCLGFSFLNLNVSSLFLLLLGIEAVVKKFFNVDISVENLAKDQGESEPPNDKATDWGNLEQLQFLRWRLSQGSLEVFRCRQFVADISQDPHKHAGEEENFEDCHPESNSPSCLPARPEMQRHQLGEDTLTYRGHTQVLEAKAGLEEEDGQSRRQESHPQKRSRNILIPGKCDAKCPNLKERSENKNWQNRDGNEDFSQQRGFRQFPVSFEFCEETFDSHFSHDKDWRHSRLEALCGPGSWGKEDCCEES